jgi:hypothetical protein
MTVAEIVQEGAIDLASSPAYLPPSFRRFFDDAHCWFRPFRNNRRAPRLCRLLEFPQIVSTSPSQVRAA